MMIQKQIVVKLQVEGLHQWKDCPIEDVSFLRDRHRHIFHIEVRKKVYHNDRDIEIIMLKREITAYLGKQPIEFGNQSCESIAEDLFHKFQCTYVSVLEDNENGAILEI